MYVFFTVFVANTGLCLNHDFYKTLDWYGDQIMKRNAFIWGTYKERVKILLEENLWGAVFKEVKSYERPSDDL